MAFSFTVTNYLRNLTVDKVNSLVNVAATTSNVVLNSNYTVQSVKNLADSWKGDWSNSTTYLRGDVVYYDYNTYLSLINNNLNYSPAGNNVQWTIFSGAGNFTVPVSNAIHFMGTLTGFTATIDNIGPGLNITPYNPQTGKGQVSIKGLLAVEESLEVDKAAVFNDLIYVVPSKGIQLSNGTKLYSPDPIIYGTINGNQSIELATNLEVGQIYHIQIRAKDIVVNEEDIPTGGHKFHYSEVVFFNDGTDYYISENNILQNLGSLGTVSIDSVNGADRVWFNFVDAKSASINTIIMAG